MSLSLSRQIRTAIAVPLVALTVVMSACSQRQPVRPTVAPEPVRPVAEEGRYLYGGPSSEKQIELFACLHSQQCFEALDTALLVATTDPRVGLVVRLVPQDAAEKAFAVRLLQLVRARPEAARGVFEKMVRHWRVTGRIGLGDFAAVAAPEVLGVPVEGPPGPTEAEAIVTADVRSFNESGGRGGPLVLLHGIRVPPEVLLR